MYVVTRLKKKGAEIAVLLFYIVTILNTYFTPDQKKSWPVRSAFLILKEREES